MHCHAVSNFDHNSSHYSSQLLSNHHAQEVQLMQTFHLLSFQQCPCSDSAHHRQCIIFYNPLACLSPCSVSKKRTDCKVKDAYPLGQDIGHWRWVQPAAQPCVKLLIAASLLFPCSRWKPACHVPHSSTSAPLAQVQLTFTGKHATPFRALPQKPACINWHPSSHKADGTICFSLSALQDLPLSSWQQTRNLGSNMLSRS